MPPARGPRGLDSGARFYEELPDPESGKNISTPISTRFPRVSELLTDASVSAVKINLDPPKKLSKTIKNEKS